jgi:hypothetical protein
MGVHHRNHEHIIDVHDKQPYPPLLHWPNIEPPQPHQMKNDMMRTGY